MTRPPKLLIRPFKPRTIQVPAMDTEPFGGCGPMYWATVTDIAFLPGEAKQIAMADPTRRRIGFASRGANSASVHNFPITSPGGGFAIPTSGIEWIKENDGCQLATWDWYGSVGMAVASFITVYQVFDS